MISRIDAGSNYKENHLIKNARLKYEDIETGQAYIVTKDHLVYITTINLEENKKLSDLYYFRKHTAVYCCVINLLRLNDGNWYRGYSLKNIRYAKADNFINLSEFMGVLKKSKGYFRINEHYTSWKAENYELTKGKISKNNIIISKIDTELIDITELTKYKEFLLGKSDIFKEDIESLEGHKLFLSQRLKEINDKIKLIK